MKTLLAFSIFVLTTIGFAVLPANPVASLVEPAPQAEEGRNRAVMVLPLTKRSITRTKSVARGSHRLTETSVDETGKAVNVKELIQQEDRAYDQKYGKIDPQLYDILQRRDKNEKIRVGFWVNLPESALNDRGLRTENMKLYEREAVQLSARRKTQLRRAVATATAPLRTYLEREMKLRVSSKREQGLTPVVFAYA